jgi:tripartite-type tricarboxylate transporter receptor subunit TctC
MHSKFVLVALLLVLTTIIGGCGGMQNTSTDAHQNKYPSRPVTLMVQYSAGGSADFLARSMEKIARQYLGQPLVIVNKPGGGGTIAWNELAESKPDGYTLGMTGTGVILQPLYGPTRYKYSTALEPIAQIAITPVIVAVRTDSPWKTIEDVVAYAKQHPGELKFGHSGLGSGTHIVGEMFAKEAEIQIEQVPFQGASEAVTAALGGHVQLLFASSPSDIKEFVKSGKLRALAIPEEKRLTQPEFADVPTFKEKGFNVVFTVWQGIAAPKELPEDVKNKLAQGFKEIVTTPEFIENMENMGMTVEYLDPKESTEKWISDSIRLTKIVQETGIAERIAAQKK